MDGSIARSGTLLFSERRAFLRDAILEGAPEAKNSVFARAFAECFVDRVAEALEEGAWTPFLTWVDVTYRRHAESVPARSLFTAAPRAVSDALDTIGTPPDVLERFRSVAQEIATIADGILSADGADHAGVLEEIDVALASVVGELRALDPMTADHAQAVSAWCGRVAERMGLTKPEARKVTRGGLVHDFGKTAIPREILTAPRCLSDEEWDLMREHVLAGERAIRETPSLRQFCSIVRSHHERFDGLGYPDGLESHRIPITVRIVAVADSFNAMIASRPYRPAMSPAHALAELKRCRGSQFDPGVVDAMIDVVTTGRP
ncbi:MAG TPA: HD-GYP domain-containing protein [Candidatus Dormibacteraeota bacterium]|nr:HD-GYP domain-containing protein [Candidatus Dormibacteraeota bacterium]